MLESNATTERHDTSQTQTFIFTNIAAPYLRIFCNNFPDRLFNFTSLITIRLSHGTATISATKPFRIQYLSAISNRINCGYTTFEKVTERVRLEKMTKEVNFQEGNLHGIVHQMRHLKSILLPPSPSLFFKVKVEKHPFLYLGQCTKVINSRDPSEFS